MSKKDFTRPADAFLTKGPDKEPTAEALEGFTVPAGYRLVKEVRNARLQLLVPQAIAAKLRTRAKLEGVSLNELCNRVFTEYLKGENNV